MAQNSTTALAPARRHAVVIGGSMAGLITAKVLSKHFAQVTILERDPVPDRPEARKGQPQTRHLHTLLPLGYQILERYLPGLTEQLRAHGAIVGDVTNRARWYVQGGYRRPHVCGLVGVLATRPLLEWLVRRQVSATPNLTYQDCTDAEGLQFDPPGARVTGVHVTMRDGAPHPAFVESDLVVDCSGRGSAGPKWLRAAGYAPPAETVVTNQVGYASRLYRRKADDCPGYDTVLVQATPPGGKRGVFIFSVEDARWLVTMGGYHGDHPPADEGGFLEYARSLPAPDAYDLLIKLEPVSDIVLHKFPNSLRRHYEKLARFPQGYLVLGDAVASFNPIYGQGMTSALAQAEALDQVLAAQPDAARLAPIFFRRAAKIVDLPWRMAVGEDFRYPETTGPKPLGTDWLNAYGTLVQRATHRDIKVYDTFVRVMSLIQSPLALFHPEIVWRVWRATRSAASL